MKGADGIILCFNLNDVKSFVTNQSEHYQSVSKFLKDLTFVFGSTRVKDIPIVLVGTKSDLEVKIDTLYIRSVIKKLKKADLNIISYEKGKGNDVAVFGKHHLKFASGKWQTGEKCIITSSKAGNGIMDVFSIMKQVLDV